MHNRFFKGLALALTVATVMTSAMPVMADEIVEEVAEEVVVEEATEEVVEEAVEVVTISAAEAEKAEEWMTTSDNAASVSAQAVALGDKKIGDKKSPKVLTVKNAYYDTIDVNETIIKGKVKSLSINATVSGDVTLVGGTKVQLYAPAGSTFTIKGDAKETKKIAKVNKKGLLTLKADKKGAPKSVVVEVKSGDKTAVINVKVQSVLLTGNKTTLYSVSGNVGTVSTNSANQIATVSVNDVDFISGTWKVAQPKKADIAKVEFDKINQSITIAPLAVKVANDKGLNKDAVKGAVKVTYTVNGKVFKATVKIANKLPKKVGKIINPAFK